jgi:8-oxo-dGTP pyrophosphatase MutT (NUDIX family)
MTKLFSGLWGEGTEWEFHTDTRYPELPVTSAFGICMIDGGVLLTKGRRGGWEIPGGHVKQGELTVDAMKREVLEEGGVVVTSWAVVGYLYIHNIHDKFSPETGELYPKESVNVYYRVASSAPKGTHDPDEAVESGIFEPHSSEVVGSTDYNIIKAVL